MEAAARGDRALIPRRSQAAALAAAWIALGGWAALPAAARGPELVKDLAAEPAFPSGSFASLPVRYGGRDYFDADDGFLGYELWNTDGTPAGTRLFADLCPGRCSGHPRFLVASASYLFFVAGNTTDGGSFWIWRSDGTDEGTFPLVDLAIPGFGSDLPLSYFSRFRNGVVFLVHERDREAWGLWFSDGTRAGTQRVARLPGRFDGNLPFDLDWPRAADAPGVHYFRWENRLWATDGTAAGTAPVKTPVVPCGVGWARLPGLAIYAGEVEGADCEPWVSDGTRRGTHRLRDLVAGTEPSYPEEFVAAGDRIYFTAFDVRGHRRLWKTDGTFRGTVAVRSPGAPRGFRQPQILAASGSRLYFAADDGVHGIELWRTDGNPTSTALVADLSPGPVGTSFGLSGGGFRGRRMFFTADPQGSGVRNALYATEGTAETTRIVTGLGAGGVRISVVAGRVYFSGPLGPEGDSLGVTDGTAEGTHRFDLARRVRSADPRQLTAAAGGLVFSVDTQEVEQEVWRSDGRSEGTEPLLGVGSRISCGTRLHPGLGGAFYYTFDRQRLGWTDGRTAREIVPPGSTGSPEGFAELLGRSIFLASRPATGGGAEVWVWRSDGTPEGTAPVAPAIRRPAPSRFSERLWTARTEAGRLRYLVQEFDDGSPKSLSSLAETDGTAEGTRDLVRFPVPKRFEVQAFVAAGANVFVLFLDPSSSRQELWTSDGTAAGTHAATFLPPGAASSELDDLAAFGDRILFSADDGAHGRELWISDDTPEGTRLLEIRPGPRGSYPQAIRALGDRALFAADDGLHGLEIWTTDGTPEGTRLASDVLPGPKGSSPRGFEVFGDELLFNAGRPTEGYELWKVPLSALP